MSVSYKIMNIYEDNDTIIYRSSCDCGDKNDDLVLTINVDNNYDTLNICMTGNLTYSDDFICYACNFLVRGIGHFRNFIKRIKGAIKLIFTGKLEQEYEFIFSDEKHVNEFLNAIREGMDNLKSKMKSSNTSKDQEQNIN